MSLHTERYPDTLTAIVLVEWFYCDHQSALAEYTLAEYSLSLIARLSQCLFYTASLGKIMEIVNFTISMGRWRSKRPGPMQCE